MKKEQALAIIRLYEDEIKICTRNIMGLKGMRNILEDMLSGTLDGEIIHKGEAVLFEVEKLLDQYENK